MKDIAGVLHAMELEHFIAVLGLVYELPYVPSDSAHQENGPNGLLHLSMVDNAFSFSTKMMAKSGKVAWTFFMAILLMFDNSVG